MIDDRSLYQRFISPTRKVNAVVELYDSAMTLKSAYYDIDDLQEVTIERVGEGKFFGYGVSHKANIKVRDVNRSKNPKSQDIVKVKLQYADLFPDMHITEVNRDENTNQLSLTAYDALEQASKIQYSSLGMAESYQLGQLYHAIARVLNLQGVEFNPDDMNLSLVYNPSFEESTNLREVLDDMAEVTQTIYFINHLNKLEFKRLKKGGNVFFNVSKDLYYTLSAKENKRLQTIAKVTELGDNVSASTSLTGSTQYIRDNGLWELRTDIAAQLNQAISAVGDLTIAQFEAEWRGLPLLEIGDKISFTTKDNKTITTFLLDDTMTFNGAFVEESRWEFEADDETESEPSTIGDKLNQTSAKVDKQNQTITLVVEKTKENEKALSELKMDVDGITMTVDNQNGKAYLKIGNNEFTVMNPDGVSQEVVDTVGTELNGYVKFTNLSNSGETTINGSNIVTGTLNGNKITANSAIYAPKLWSGTSTYDENFLMLGGNSSGNLQLGAPKGSYTNTNIYAPNNIYMVPNGVPLGQEEWAMKFGHATWGGIEHSTCYIGYTGGVNNAQALYQNSGTGMIGIKNSASRFKHDIKPVEDERIDPHKLYDIDVVQFKWNDGYFGEQEWDYNTNEIGMIAEDVEKNYPSAAIYDSDGQISNWSERELVAPMLYLIQEQKKEIEELKARVEKLEGEKANGSI